MNATSALVWGRAGFRSFVPQAEDFEMPHRLAGLALLLGAAIVCFGAEPPRPNPKSPVDYAAWLNRQYRVEVRDNAAGKYAEACAAFKDAPELFDSADAVLRGSWSSKDMEPLRDWVRNQDKALTLLAAAAHMPKCYLDVKAADPGRFVLASLPATELRGLVKLLMVRARLKLAAHDLDGALDDAGTLLRVARHLEAQPLLLCQLIATAQRGLVNSFLIDLCARSDAGTDYTSVVRWLHDLDAGPPPYGDVVLAEKVQMWDIVQRAVRDTDGDGQPDTVQSQAGENRPLPPGTTWSDLVEEADRIFAKVAELFRQPDYPKVQKLAETLENPVIGEFKLEGLPGMELRAWDTWIRATDVRFETLATYRAARVLVHMQAYRAQYGRWPPDLKTPTADERPETRTDPFAGRDFVYRVRDGQPVLYSVGRDGQDDGGRWPTFDDGKPQQRWVDESGDYIFWPPAKR
jgi:hypothetical protein